VAALPTSRTVTAPDGGEWLLRATSPIRVWDSGRLGDYDESDLAELPLMALDALWTYAVRPLVYLVFVLPFAYRKARRTRAVRIEAVLREPPHVLVWMTTRGLAEGVLDEIAEGVAAGRRVEPAGAVFAGDRG
jgi:hypothetical protein